MSLRQIIQLESSGEVFAQYRSTREAEASTGITRTSITKCLNGKYKSAGGFRWVYTDTPAPATSYYLLKFAECDRAVWNEIASQTDKKSSKRNFLLYPKYLYFPHLLIREYNRSGSDGVKKISQKVFGGITSENPGPTSRIFKFWIDLGVVEVVIKANNGGNGKKYTSTTYKLTDAFKNNEVSQDWFNGRDHGRFIARLQERVYDDLSEESYYAERNVKFKTKSDIQQEPVEAGKVASTETPQAPQPSKALMNIQIQQEVQETFHTAPKAISEATLQLMLDDVFNSMPEKLKSTYQVAASRMSDLDTTGH